MKDQKHLTAYITHCCFADLFSDVSSCNETIYTWNDIRKWNIITLVHKKQNFFTVIKTTFHFLFKQEHVEEMLRNYNGN